MDLESDTEDKEKEKAARVEASIREREKEVQRTLAVHLRDRDNEREQHKHDEAMQIFNALLADLVTSYFFIDFLIPIHPDHYLSHICLRIAGKSEVLF